MKRIQFLSTSIAVIAIVSLCLPFGSYATTPCCTKIVSSGQEYRLEYSTVSEPVEYTAYKKVVETQFIEEEVTSYQTVWEPQKRERRYTVARSVPETMVQQRRHTVNRPVDETEYKDTSYDVTRYVPETIEREEHYLVPRQVYETQEREIIENRRVPVQETTIQDRVYTVNRPVTTLASQTVDRGGFVESVTSSPGRTYQRLAWQRAGEHYDAATGTNRWRMPGLYWTPMQGEEKYQVNRVYQPRYVTETVPVTTTFQEQRIEQVPVTTTTFRDEQISRIETVQVPRTIQEEFVRKIPVTTYKPVVERIQQTTPVTVRRIVTEEKIEEVPVTTYKTIYEERIEPYEVKVAKVIPIKQIVRKPVSVEKWVPYTYTVDRKRVVVNRIPIEREVIVSEVSSVRPTPLPSSERIVGEVIDREVIEPVGTVRTMSKPAEGPQGVLETSDVSSTYKTSDPAEKVPVAE